MCVAQHYTVLLLAAFDWNEEDKRVTFSEFEDIMRQVNTHKSARAVVVCVFRSIVFSVIHTHFIPPNWFFRICPPPACPRPSALQMRS